MQFNFYDDTFLFPTYRTVFPQINAAAFIWFFIILVAAV